MLGCATTVARQTAEGNTNALEHFDGCRTRGGNRCDLTFLVTATGKPYGGNAFSEQFRNWCDAAGLPRRCKPHGLRKAACRRLAEAGCSANEIMSISGHATMKELVRYTAAADQARLARNAFAKAVIR